MFYTIILFIVACLSLNTYFYVGHGHNNAYDAASQPAVITEIEYKIKMGDTDYYFLDNHLKQAPVSLRLTKNMGKPDPLSSFMALPGAILNSLFLTVVIIFTYSKLFILLPDEVHLTDLKIRLND
jgi:hypothetical protein